MVADPAPTRGATRRRSFGRLGPVVVVLPGEQAHVERNSRLRREGAQDVPHHLRGELADHVAGEGQVHRGEGPPADVNHRLHERLVQRHRRLAHAHDPRPVAHCLREGAATLAMSV